MTHIFVAVSDARELLHDIVTNAEAGQETVLTRYKKPVAVVMGMDLFEEMVERAEGKR